MLHITWPFELGLIQNERHDIGSIVNVGLKDCFLPLEFNHDESYHIHIGDASQSFYCTLQTHP
jgi:hypothetical protein